MIRKNGYKQGIFTPINKSKTSDTPKIYRSGVELKYMRWLDNNSNIIRWDSESVVIPYIKPTDGKVHKYFIDFVFEIKDKNGKLHKFIVEVKPEKQCSAPKKTKNKKAKSLLYEQIMFAVNTSKWNSAKQWAAKHGYTFTIVTENQIKALK